MAEVNESTAPAVLQIAESPAKAAMLQQLEEERQKIERGETIALVTISVLRDRHFDTHSSGNIGMVELAGFLGRAWLDAQEQM